MNFPLHDLLDLSFWSLSLRTLLHHTTTTCLPPARSFSSPTLSTDVPLKKVNFSARNEYEYVSNYKILQNAFDAHGVPNHIPVDRLIKCKFQDNMEFLQWLKKYWDGHWTGMDYDAVGRRGGARGSFGSPSSAIGGVKGGLNVAIGGWLVVNMHSLAFWTRL